MRTTDTGGRHSQRFGHEEDRHRKGTVRASRRKCSHLPHATWLFEQYEDQKRQEPPASFFEPAGGSACCFANDQANVLRT